MGESQRKVHSSEPGFFLTMWSPEQYNLSVGGVLHAQG